MRTASLFLIPLLSLPFLLLKPAGTISIPPDLSESIPAGPYDTCVAVPSAFTPNKDGLNDRIGPIENGCRIRFLLFRIYNRRGQVIFVSESVGQDWDGTVKGVPQDTGFYPYICYYTAEDGIGRWFNGTITLIR